MWIYSGCSLCISEINVNYIFSDSSVYRTYGTRIVTTSRLLFIRHVCDSFNLAPLYSDFTCAIAACTCLLATVSLGLFLTASNAAFNLMPQS